VACAHESLVTFGVAQVWFLRAAAGFLVLVLEHSGVCLPQPYQTTVGATVQPFPDPLPIGFGL